MKLYGLKTCDSCRKMLKWLRENHLDADFVDVRGDEFTRGDIERIVSAAGWETVLNRKSTTWRSLGEAERAVSDSTGAVELIAVQPALMKRPVVEIDGKFIVGAGPDQQAELLEMTAMR